jgi:hypothetical protein
MPHGVKSKKNETFFVLLDNLVTRPGEKEEIVKQMRYVQDLSVSVLENNTSTILYVHYSANF